MTSESIPPPSCQIAFKEWAGICQALVDGRQSLILRKGGIDEDNGEFRPEYSSFWLYPTHLHESQQGIREPIPPLQWLDAPPGMIALPGLVVVQCVSWVDREEKLESVADLHVWTRETVLKRFHYRKPGLWVLGIRAYKADPTPRIAMTPEHSGCRSWVPLEEPIWTEELAPVVEKSESDPRMVRIRSLSGRGSQ